MADPLRDQLIQRVKDYAQKHELKLSVLSYRLTGDSNLFRKIIEQDRSITTRRHEKIMAQLDEWEMSERDMETVYPAPPKPDGGPAS